MTGRTQSGGRRLRAERSFRAWARDLSFQLIVVPGFLALVPLVLGDMLGHPGWAAAVTVLIIVVALGVYWWLFTKRRTGGDLGSGHDVVGPVPGLVVALNTAPLNANHGLRFLVDNLHPQVVGLLVTEAASELAREAQHVLAERNISLIEVDVQPSRETQVVHLKDQAKNLIEQVADNVGGRGTKVVCDMTMGSSVTSIGLYEAAIETNVGVTYIYRPHDDAEFNHRRIIEIHRPDSDDSAP